MLLHTQVTLPVLRPFSCCKKSLVIPETCGHHICAWSKDLIMDAQASKIERIWIGKAAFIYKTLLYKYNIEVGY